DPPRIRLERAGDRPEERRLPCAVRPDQCGDRVPLDVERGAVDSSDATEGPDDSFDVEQGRHSSTISRLFPSSPCGRSTTRSRMRATAQTITSIVVSEDERPSACCTRCWKLLHWPLYCAAVPMPPSAIVPCEPPVSASSFVAT